MNKKAKCSLKVRGLLCFLSVISLSVNTFARPQEDIRITLELNDISLETAIDNIEEQSSYLFMNSDVDVNQTISLSVTNETIKNVCNALFTPINVDYRIEGHHIYISRKPEPDPVRISGTVLDQTGLPVPGAAVLESGTSNGTTTGLDGSFTLTVSDPTASIEVNCLGYNTVTLPVGSRTVFNLTLEEEAVAGREERQLHQLPCGKGGRRDHQHLVFRCRRGIQGRAPRQQVHQPVIQRALRHRRYPDV